MLVNHREIKVYVDEACEMSLPLFLRIVNAIFLMQRITLTLAYSRFEKCFLNDECGLPY